MSFYHIEWHSLFHKFQINVILYFKQGKLDNNEGQFGYLHSLSHGILYLQ